MLIISLVTSSTAVVELGGTPLGGGSDKVLDGEVFCVSVEGISMGTVCPSVSVRIEVVLTDEMGSVVICFPVVSETEFSRVVNISVVDVGVSVDCFDCMEEVGFCVGLCVVVSGTSVEVSVRGGSELD